MGGGGWSKWVFFNYESKFKKKKKKKNSLVEERGGGVAWDEGGLE